MVDDLTCIYPREFLPILFWLGRRGNWLESDVLEPQSERDVLIPRSIYHPKVEVLNTAPACPEKQQFTAMFNRMQKEEALLQLGFLEAGGVLVTQGPKLFSPSFEQFESLGHVDLHIPIADFRSPYPALVIRIPNEWRLNRSRELGIDVQRQPRHVMVRASLTRQGKVHILSVLKYPELEYYNIVTDQPAHRDLQTAFEYVVNYTNRPGFNAGLDKQPPELRDQWVTKRNEFRYCTDAIHCALNCCLMMVNFGCREGGPLDPRLYAKHRRDGDVRRHADFKAVDMVQNVVIRHPSVLLGEPLPPNVAADGTPFDGGPRWEVKPHWRRGHWRRKPGWQAYVERNEQPPLSFVRPTLVRQDRIVGDVSESQATYNIR